jgi:hypothetical protein
MINYIEIVATLEGLGWQQVDILSQHTGINPPVVARYGDVSVQLLSNGTGFSTVSVLVDNDIRVTWLFEDYPKPEDVSSILALIGAW